MRIVGDTNKLQQIRQKLSQSTKITEIAAKAAKGPVKLLVLESFDGKKSPFGFFWDLLKKPKGLPPLAGLKDFFDFSTQKNEVRVTNSKTYAVYHQEGTKTIPARPYLPEEKMSSHWESKISIPVYHAIAKQIIGRSK